MTEVTFFTNIEDLKLANPPVPAREFGQNGLKNKKAIGKRETERRE